MESQQYEHLLHEIVESRRHTDEVVGRLGAGLRAEMRQQGDELRRHAEDVAGNLRHELLARIDASAEETRRHAHVVAESLRGEIRQVAEGVTTLDEKTDRRFAEVQERFAETHSLIRLSYHDLDRRLRAVEEAGR
jgi:hypothetical protein